MAVYSVPTSGISFSSFKTWSPSYSSNSNISLQTVLENMYPDDTAPYSVSTIRGQGIRYGSLVAGTGGNVRVTYPYSGGSGTSVTITPVSYGTYSYITIEAIPTYPATMHSWRTAANGGGSQISTSTSINLTISDYTSQGTFYAHFNN